VVEVRRLAADSGSGSSVSCGAPTATVAAVLVAALLLTACAGPRVRAPAARSPRPAALPPATTGPSGEAPAPDVLALARSLLGSAYRYGGASRRGFDCSGLTLYVFGRQGVALPRTTEAQAEVGHWVPLDELTAGDLVFFRQGANPPHHVGIVSSRPGEPLRMIHASTSSGVVETGVLASPYWLRQLSFGRRVLPDRQRGPAR
jgi:cell wall-associated NlpC family hydrolase